jgi:hypothetical protein
VYNRLNEMTTCTIHNSLAAILQSLGSQSSSYRTSLTSSYVFARHVARFAFYLSTHSCRHLFLISFVATVSADSLRMHALIFGVGKKIRQQRRIVPVQLRLTTSHITHRYTMGFLTRRTAKEVVEQAKLTTVKLLSPILNLGSSCKSDIPQTIVTVKHGLVMKHAVS